MAAVDASTSETGGGARPALWGEDAPAQFDRAVPWWVKLAIVAVLIALGILFLDQPLAGVAKGHPIPDLGYAGTVDKPPPKWGDAGRELMWLEQWGQGVCSVVVILAVALLDTAGKRRALAIAIGCLATLAVTHVLKDVIGRARPNIGDMWGGPMKGFTGGADWGSFPSAHTSGAFALAAGLAWFYPRGRGLFVALAIITAGERVLHGAHYFSDVVAGMAVGVMVTRGTLHAKWAGRVIALLPAKWGQWWLLDR